MEGFSPDSLQWPTGGRNRELGLDESHLFSAALMPRCDTSTSLWNPERPPGVTRLAVVERESDLAMAGAAVLAFSISKHREMSRAFLRRGEYFGMAEFTAVPDGMLLVRELNG